MLSTQPLEKPASANDWWHGAVIYHVYPRSFRDTNGDGIGDLRGVIEGLDYIQSLGVDAIWLSPFFTSPMCDFGYDVSDYCGVDPIFGTMDDFDHLIIAAHERGLKLIIDQVYSHTSDQHDWFLQSRSDRTNAKSDWYVWADPKADGSPPNNWQSVFGGGSWSWDNSRRQYYLHNFLTSQPDLNVHNVDVQNALLDVARFWLDKGVDGFRLDAINFAMHDKQLRDNPPVLDYKREPTRSFDYQEHLYNQSHPDIVNFLERVRAVMDGYEGRFTVAEVGGELALNEMKSFTQGDNRLNSAYSFEFLYADSISAELVTQYLKDWPGQDGDGWPSWAFSNHDAPRAISRWSNMENRATRAKFFMLLLMCLRGNVFLYQGEELGLSQADIPFNRIQDPEALNNWPETQGRDGARTPMPWDAAKDFAGFSSVEPWLPIDARHYDEAVTIQNGDTNSVLNFTRKLIRARQSSPALKSGSLEFEKSVDGLLVFTRKLQAETLVCVFNFSNDSIEWQPKNIDALELVIGTDLQTIPKRLSSYSGYIARIV